MLNNRVYVRRRYCPIKNCENYRGVPDHSGVRFFHAPSLGTDLPVRNKWIDNIKVHQEFNPGLKISICQLHFESQYIYEGTHRPGLKKGAVPTIFPEHESPIDNPNTADHGISNLPKTTENAKHSKKAAINCKRCFETAIELSRATVKLIGFDQKIRKQNNKIRGIQHNLEHTSSQLIPVRIDVSSHNNQNYIPQKMLKKKPVEPMKQLVKIISGDVLDRPEEKIRKAETPNDSEVTANEECANEDEGEDADDNELPECERQQFAQYVMASIGDLPEKSATQAMMTVKLFLQKWQGLPAD